MAEESLKLLILGAHPDDAEYHAGGLASIYRARGHEVKMVSATDGRSGHQAQWGESLARRRREEARTSAMVIGAQSEVWENPDGRLQPTIELRERIIREIRGFRPDLVLTHRTNDYHPDHRALGIAVQDASYLVTVPAICSDAPIMHRDPVVGYLPDLFTRPTAFRPDVAFDIGPQVETIVRMLACHESQVFEWLPFNEGIAGEVPEHDVERVAWLAEWFRQKLRPRTAAFRRALCQTYGVDAGERVEFCEAFEISEYASPLDAAARRRLFWFVPAARP
jgi:LmbE family N-acetylglucosaminyl deacetylase